MKSAYSLIILALLILAAAGFFAYIYYGHSVTTSLNSSSPIASTRATGVKDPSILGEYFVPHAAFNTMTLNADGTFNQGDDNQEKHGTYSIEGSQITFKYDDKSPALQLNIAKQPPTTGWYITGTVGGVAYYYVQQ